MNGIIFELIANYFFYLISVITLALVAFVAYLAKILGGTIVDDALEKPKFRVLGLATFALLVVLVFSFLIRPIAELANGFPTATGDATSTTSQATPTLMLRDEIVAMTPTPTPTETSTRALTPTLIPTVPATLTPSLTPTSTPSSTLTPTSTPAIQIGGPAPSTSPSPPIPNDCFENGSRPNGKFLFPTGGGEFGRTDGVIQLHIDTTAYRFFTIRYAPVNGQIVDENQIEQYSPIWKCEEDRCSREVGNTNEIFLYPHEWSEKPSGRVNLLLVLEGRNNFNARFCAYVSNVDFR